MATYYARATGNINGSIWATTPSGTASNLFSSFTSSDTLVANSFTVTINVNTTVLEIRNDTTGGATNGGGFTLNSSVTLNSNCISGTVALLTFNGGIGVTSSIIGNITSNGGNSVIFSGGAVGTLNITGSLNGVSGTALYINGGTTINVIGNCISSGGRAIYVINCVPNINITGNLTGGSTICFDSFAGSLLTGGAVTITGNISGTGNASIIQLIANYSTTMIINGSVTGSSNAVGINITASSQSAVTIIRAKGNGFGNGSVGLTSQVGVANNSQSAIVRVYEIEYGDLGQSPTSGPVQLLDNSTNVCLVYRTGGLSKKTLVDASSTAGAFPSASNVRSGVSYNSGNTIGTMAVPSPSSVSYGISVDNTTGTAVLTPSSVWDYLTSNISTSGSIGERLKNCSTIASVGQQLSNSLSGL